MSYQLSTIRTRIQQKLDNTTFDTTKLTQFVNDGLRDIVVQAKPQYMRAEASYTTAQGASTLTTSATDVLVPLSFRTYTPVNYAQLLPYIPYEDVDLLYPNVNLLGQGPPVAWSVFAGTPFLVNNADQTYTLKGKYVKIPPELVNDSDVPIIPETFSELLVLAGYKRALQHDDDFNSAQVIQQEIDTRIADMTTFLRPQTGTPHVMRQQNRNYRRGSR